MCVCVWFALKLGYTGTETVDKVRRVFGRSAYARSTIFNWHKAFKTGRTKLGDLVRPGAPQRARTRRKIRQCKVLVDGKKNVCVDKLSWTLGISQGSTYRLLTKDLKLKKKAAKLVPHRLTEAQCRKTRFFCQDFLRRTRWFPGFLNWVLMTDEAWFYLMETGTKQENMQWLSAEENRPQVARRPRNCKKLMVIPFFDRRGLLHVEFYQNQTINQTLFRLLLEEVWEHVRVQWGNYLWWNRHKYLLHMDNAPAHSGDMVKWCMENLEWRRLPHPPYSPDLSPCDFFLFPLLNKRLRAREFGDLTLLKLAIERELGDITVEQWRRCFRDWVRRCRKCLAFNGGYFEGMKHLPNRQ